MSSTDKKKPVTEEEKEVLENIMEELEKEAEEKTENEAKGEENKSPESENGNEEVKTEEVKAEEADDKADEALDDSKDSKDSEDDSSKTEESKKKGFFSKKEKKDPLKEKVDELNDRVMRQMAEFENFRKRTEKEKAGMYDMGARDLIEKILPVVDNFERGLKDADTSDPFAEGMSMIYKQLMTILEGIGVTPIEAVGKEFDPNFHNAVMQIESEEYEAGIVAQEFQKGYMYHDTVLRHSMVGVAK